MGALYGAGTGQASSRDAPYINHIELQVVSRFVALLAAVCRLPRSAVLPILSNMHAHINTPTHTPIHTHTHTLRNHLIISNNKCGFSYVLRGFPISAFPFAEK